MSNLTGSSSTGSSSSKESGSRGRDRQSAATSLWLRLSLAALMGFGGVALPALVAPPVAQAYTSRVNLYVVREQNESFTTLVQRSEIIARAAVQRSFDADVLMTDVIVTVIGDNQGISVPILTVPVSRGEWRLVPDVTQWAQYFEASRYLVMDDAPGAGDN